MAQYGELLDTYDPHREEVYGLIDIYFNKPEMVKIKDVDNHSMYMIKVHCLLTNDYRYLIAMVHKDNNNIGTQKRLSELFWVSFQTRTLPDNHNIPRHPYESSFYKPLIKKLERMQVTKELSIYKCDEFPIRVTLLHRKPNINSEYHPTGNLLSALETYHTVISFTN